MIKVSATDWVSFQEFLDFVENELTEEDAAYVLSLSDDEYDKLRTLPLSEMKQKVQARSVEP